MIDKFKPFTEKLDISFVNLVLMISFTYLMLYKLSLTYFLDVQWYISLASIQQLILSSVSIIFLTVLGLILGLTCSAILYKLKASQSSKVLVIEKILRPMSPFVLFGITLYFQKYIWQISYISIVSLIIIFTVNLLPNLPNKPIKILLSITIGIISIITPILWASDDSYRIKYFPEKVLPQVVFKEKSTNKEKWYLLEIIGENAVLTKKNFGKEKVQEYRIIKFEEIDKLLSENKEKKIWLLKFLEEKTIKSLNRTM